MPTQTFDKRLAGHVKIDLFILDDFAMREFTPTQADDLYELISSTSAAPGTHSGLCLDLLGRSAPTLPATQANPR